MTSMTGAVALAAVAAFAAVAPTPAKAGPPESPFAGTYDWNSGTFAADAWAITISGNGQITGTLLRSSDYTKGSINGRVNHDGSYSFTMNVTAPTFEDSERPTRGGPKYRTSRIAYDGILASDGDGNIAGTVDPSPRDANGGSFVWLRT